MNSSLLEQQIREALPGTGFTGICFRNVSPIFSAPDKILSTVGSRIKGGRYNFIGSFGLLYLSCDVHTCLEETTHATRAEGWEVARALPRVLVAIEVRLSQVLDLTDAEIQRAIGVNLSTLIETNWESVQEEDGEAVTQTIGRLAREAGFEAILVPSAVAAGKNLNVFIDKLLPSSQLTVVNADQLPASQSTT